MKNLNRNLRHVLSIGTFYLFVSFSMLHSLIIFYVFGKVYSSTELSNFIFYHIIALFTSMGIDFGAQLLGQRRTARRHDRGLGNAWLLVIEVGGRVPLCLFMGFIVSACFVLLNVEWFYIVYVLAYIGASPIAVNWLFLGINKAHVPTVWAGIKTVFSVLLFVIPDLGNGMVIVMLGVVYFLSTFGIFVSSAFSQGCSLRKIFSSRSFHPIRIFRFLRQRGYLGGLSLIDSLIQFIPYFVIDSFASRSDFLAQFYFIDRISRGLVQIYQPISLYLISHLPMRKALDRNLFSLWPLFVVLAISLLLISATLTIIYGIYFVDLFTENIALSWILFGLLLVHAIVSAISGIVCVIFVFNLGHDKIFIKGQVLGLLVMLIISVGAALTGSLYFVASAMVLTKMFMALYYTFNGAIPYIRQWKHSHFDSTNIR